MQADDAEVATREAREARVAFAAPHWTAEQVANSVAASDNATPAADGLRSLLATVEVDARDIAAFHSANTDAFGGRPLAVSGAAAEQLWRVHLARMAAGIADPENGLFYPPLGSGDADPATETP